MSDCSTQMFEKLLDYINFNFWMSVSKNGAVTLLSKSFEYLPKKKKSISILKINAF